MKGLPLMPAKNSSPTLFSLHWLAFTVYCDERKARDILSMWNLEDTLENKNHGGRGFRRIHEGLNGLKLYTQPIQQRKADDLSKDYDYSKVENWHDLEKVDREVQRDMDREKRRQDITYCSIEMPGECVSSLLPEQIRVVMNYIILEKIKLKITRLDLAFDTQKFRVSTVWNTIMADKITTRASRDSMVRHLNATQTNDGISIGARTSLQFLRIYTKFDQQNHFTGKYTRFELELHDERATHCLLNLLVLPLDQWVTFSMSIARGYIEFHAQWWERFVGDVDKVWLRLEQKTPTVQRLETWLYDQVCVSLATYLLAKRKKNITPDGEITYDLLTELNDLIQAGQRRLKEKHKHMIEKYEPDTKPSYAVFNLTADELIANFLKAVPSEEISTSDLSTETNVT